MGGIVADHILHQRHQLLLGVRASGASGAGVLVAAVVMGVRMIVVVRMGVLMGMRAPVGMGMLVGVHGFIVMHNSVPFCGGSPAARIVFRLHYTRRQAFCKEYEIGKIIPRAGMVL